MVKLTPSLERLIARHGADAIEHGFEMYNRARARAVDTRMRRQEKVRSLEGEVERLARLVRQMEEQQRAKQDAELHSLLTTSSTPPVPHFEPTDEEIDKELS